MSGYTLLMATLSAEMGNLEPSFVHVITVTDKMGLTSKGH